jgi:ribonucleoside-triphosphate reductase (thioredoxin)
VRAGDSVDDLERKVRMAAVLGTWQATLTKWKESVGGVTGGLRPVWRENTEAERLLGLSLTGILDNELMAGRRGDTALCGALRRLRAAAVDANAGTASALRIAPAAAITCVKPSGTVSQLVDAASGIHPRHAHYYLRRVRGSNVDPLTKFLAASGVPHEPCMYSRGSTVRRLQKRCAPGSHSLS